MRGFEEHNDGLPGLSEVKKISAELYIPLAEVERDILWPNRERLENVAEHSYHLAVTAVALGEPHGMDPGKLALRALLHDSPERSMGDDSIWDFEGRKNKEQREAEATAAIEIDFQETPIITSVLRSYQELTDEEDRFVYALDKLLATLMIVQDGGRNWKRRGFTFEQYRQTTEEILRPKIAVHSLVLKWYDELFAEIEARQEELFVSTMEEVPVIP